MTPVEVLNSDKWKDCDMLQRSLGDWLLLARQIQDNATLSRIDKIFISGRMACNLDRANICSFDHFNKMLVEQGGADLREQWLSGFEKPIEVNVFPGESSESVVDKVRMELQWRRDRHA